MVLRPFLSRRAFLAFLVIGALARGVWLRSPGTEDLEAFGVWMHYVVADGPTQVYGVGGSPPNRRQMTFDGVESRVDYPPVALYALAATGRLYGLAFGEPRGLSATIVPLKLLAASASAVLTIVIWFAVRRRDGVEAARFATVAFWANPAAILHSAVLGYIGSIAVLPAVAALVAANAGRAWVGGALFAVGVWTKPQSLLVAPAILLALAGTGTGSRRRFASAGLSAGAATAVILLPFALAGALPNLVIAVGGLVTDGWLSAQAANVWWLVGYALRVGQRVGQDGLAAFAGDSLMVQLSHPVETLGFIGQRSTEFLIVLAVTWTGVLGIVAWATWRASGRNDSTTRTALAAFVVHTYFTLALQVHENHLFLALPLLAMVAAEHRAYRWLLALVSVIIALNLNLFYGFGRGAGFALPRSATLVDATLWLALVNIGAFAWHARLFIELVRNASPMARPGTDAVALDAGY